jgi:hypothetical protein
MIGNTVTAFLGPLPIVADALHIVLASVQSAVLPWVLWIVEVFALDACAGYLRCL